jgi:hypothetical protein
MNPPIEWLESCHAVASVKVNSRRFNTYFETKKLPGNPALFAAFHPVYLEGQMGGSEWFLYIPKPESFPTNRENVHVIPGNQTSYMVTVRGTLSQKMGPEVNVPVKQPQHLTRFYIWENGRQQEFLLQVMLTKKEHDYLHPIKTRAILTYLEKFSPYFPRLSGNVSNEVVFHSVLCDNQFLGRELWFAYHPFYVQPKKESDRDKPFYYHIRYGKRAKEASMFTPLDYVMGKKSSFESFPREIVPCERARSKPPSDILVYEPKEREFSNQIAERERIKYNRNAFYKRMGIIIYENVKISEQKEIEKIILRTNLFKILNFPDESKKLLQQQYLGFVEEIRSERESGEAGSDDSGNNWQRVKNIIKTFQSRVDPILYDVNYSTFPIITEYLVTKLKKFEPPPTQGSNLDKWDELLVRLDLTKLFDFPPPPYKVDYTRLHKMLPFAQTAQGMLEEVQREWKQEMEERTFRSAGVRPDPNFGYWPAETSQHPALKCGSFFCT